MCLVSKQLTLKNQNNNKCGAAIKTAEYDNETHNLSLKPSATAQIKLYNLGITTTYKLFTPHTEAFFCFFNK